MEKLRLYLNGLTPDKQHAFAKRCGTSVGYLRKAISISQQLSEKIVIAIERESEGEIRCEDLRPDVDWQFLRNTA
jgi:DNA-binding transcriptional regulator YdaS (Cro superfamily)